MSALLWVTTEFLKSVCVTMATRCLCYWTLEVVFNVCSPCSTVSLKYLLVVFSKIIPITWDIGTVSCSIFHVGTTKLVYSTFFLVLSRYFVSFWQLWMIRESSARLFRFILVSSERSSVFQSKQSLYFRDSRNESTHGLHTCTGTILASGVLILTTCILHFSSHKNAAALTALSLSLSTYPCDRVV